jgi:hypothetical protein
MPYVCWALGAYVVRLLYGRKKVPILEGILDAVAALCSGLFMAAIITIYPAVPYAAQIGISALAGLIGPDLLAGVLAITKTFKESPDQFLLKYIYAIRGIKTGMDVPTLAEKLESKSEDTKD